MKRFQAIFGWLILTALLLPSVSQAASLYIDPAFSTLYRGDAVELSVRLDVDEDIGECVNAVDAVIKYPANLEPVDVSIGESIFSMWVQRPEIDREAQTISFAGGIPNGYCGRVIGDPRLTNKLVQIVFRSPGFVVGQEALDDNQAVVDFAPESSAYLNDGLGTRITPATLPATLTLAEERGNKVQTPWRDTVDADTIPPEEFGITLEQQQHSDKYFIVFNTTDKQTGIDIYQVMEEPLSEFGSFDWGRADAPWVETRSPYVLKDQSLNSIVRVRAIDKAGNEYVATFVPDESMRSITGGQIVGYGLFIAVFAIFLAAVGLMIWVLIRRKRKANDNSEDTEDNEGDEYDEESEDKYYEEDDNDDQENK